jgi:hypothetical protein
MIINLQEEKPKNQEKYFSSLQKYKQKSIFQLYDSVFDMNLIIDDELNVKIKGMNPGDKIRHTLTTPGYYIVFDSNII